MCYQIPALMMDGITLVISPLISLMKDQVSNLNQVGILAAYINSSLTTAQYYKVLDLARAGRYPIIYVAPERLVSEDFLRFALDGQVKISMVAVDEAHCVSQWGQDFRPSYLKIVDFINRLPVRPVVSAFTATATAEVRDDIIDILMLRDPKVMTTGFDRSNLYFAVQNPKDKYATLVNYLERHKGESGIIYCLTRKVVEEVCSQLIREGFSMTRYHAGLSDGERKQNQEDFIYDRAQIMVATNAFGMGIDKSNVRFVVHYNMPKNMESYYQEAGRAGRDGEPAECILLYGGQDVVTNQFFIDHNQDNEALDAVTREIVMERDRERLRKMTFYCFTNECLRDYILRYFGEYGSNYCGNCSNCLSQFEEVDVTDIARALIGCVESCRQRYGTNVIIDTVHGANTAKIRNYRMDENPHYAELAKVPAYKLRQVMNHLMLDGYLGVTNDGYAIVRLTGKSGDVQQEGAVVTMKMAREQEHPARMKSEKKGKKGRVPGVSLSETDEGLFEKLRALRTEIAKEENVPPYIVFSDKTLVSMCMVKPRTKAEMLTVSGVGEFKFDKYGGRFLDCVTAAAGGPEAEEANLDDSCYDGDDLYFSSDSDGFDDWNLETAMAAWETSDLDDAIIPVNDTAGTLDIPEKKKKTKNSKTEFIMTEELADQVHYSEKVTLSDFIGQINDLRDEDAMKRLTIKSVEQWLTDSGNFEVWFLNGTPRKRLTGQGEDFGIEAEKRLSEKGNEYDVFYYTEKAQRQIVRWLLKAG
ncbi:RecQ family ATP-dependent DNA helicase [Enterocloster aldenensis]|uniref:RecQ family ATP-dependent DNA helicase n=1 Tax=Enterocloster aldenensis TaxID=358742 RepID=UPI0025A3A00F|nr:RecQ family ATP-dependent DNA helicase [Enterocloster aldenensis]